MFNCQADGGHRPLSHQSRVGTVSQLDLSHHQRKVKKKKNIRYHHRIAPNTPRLMPISYYHKVIRQSSVAPTTKLQELEHPRREAKSQKTASEP